ncbi:MAG TPA: CusA/CzcA family heavy metal efflux RND transporter [Oculatellaceae cyanobacterium]|jgi:cobalt-zinc-cadmium resistance protein CzcA|nr:efflux RND transporter permease subunit [Cyanobacteria bacterium SZAS LIN-5]
MVDAIVSFSVKQRLLVLMATVFLIAAGLFNLQNLPIDAVPDITNVQVQVLTSAPSLAPLEVERRITFPIEIAMGGLPSVTQVRSISKFGISVVTIVFDEQVDTYFARQLVLERLSQVRQQIPESIGSPEMGPISTGLGEIYQYELKPDQGRSNDPQYLRTVQDWTVRRQLMGLPGVAEVNSYGGKKKQYQIRVDPAKLMSYGLNLRDVVTAVLANNENVGGAYIEHGGEQYILRGIGLAQTTAQLGNIVVKSGKEGVPIYVRDIADVITGSAIRQGAVLADGKGEIVAGIVMMLKGENSRSVVERTKTRIEQIQKTLPAGVRLKPFYDRSELVDRTIHTVESNLTEGAILVIVVLLVVLGNWRGALLVASVIPLAMLFAAICMNVFKVSGNLMSLGALDFGLIVDGAVVMVENSIRRLALNQEHGRPDSNTKTIHDACLEVGRPVVFAVAIIAIVYMPIFSLTGIEGKMFKPMSLTIVFALAGSLLLSLTYIPAMLTLIMQGDVSEKDSFLVRLVKPAYEKALFLAASYKSQTFAVALALLILSLITLPMLGAEFIPRLDEGSLAVQIQQLPSVSLTQSIATTTKAEQVIRSFPEVTKVVSKIGRAEVATDPMGVDTVDVYVALKPPEQWTSAKTREELVDKMSKALEQNVPQAVFSFSQPVELRTAELIAGVRSDIAVKIFGDDLDKLRETAEKVSKIVGTVPGAADVKVEQTAGLPQLIIEADRDAIARYGINAEDVNNLIQSLMAGQAAGTVYEGEQRFEIVVRLNPASTKDVESIRKLLVAAPALTPKGGGAMIPLSSLAKIKVEEGPAQISREDRRRRIVVELNVRGRDIGSFVKEAQKRIDQEIRLPEGYYIQWGGQFENLQRATFMLSIVVPVALLLIFIFLFMTFGSISQSLLIYTGIPFAIVGGIFALALRGMPFSISAGVGFIALSGVAVLNGVVMVSYINTLKHSMDTETAVIEGAITRLRPVLMTALVASLGFFPMAFSSSAGAEVQRPLATVVIGGLVTSSLLTLLLLPNLYLWFEGLAKKMTNKKTRASRELAQRGEIKQ